MTLPHSMLENVRKLRALEYAQTLYPGATVDEADMRYCAEFMHLLPAAMAQHGLVLVSGTVERLETRAPITDARTETNEQETGT